MNEWPMSKTDVFFTSAINWGSGDTPSCQSLMMMEPCYENSEVLILARDDSADSRSDVVLKAS